MSIFITDKAKQYVEVVNGKSDKYKILFQVKIDIPATNYTESSKTIYVFDNGVVLENLYEHDDITGHILTDSHYRLLT
jgi:hypothetical protein